MPASIGVNLRVTGHCRQGGRKYMEDFFSVAYQQTEDEKDLEYAFFGIYDGHGGAEAAAFAKEHLMETIIKHKNFWSENDEEVLRAIKDGYIATHYAMWREQSKWPRTSSGLPSTAGTTASVAFIRRGKIYIGHVGDSGIILGYQEPGSTEWKAKPLTMDHKPENPEEMKRIEGCGGKVVAKSGVPRVVWNRPKIGHQGPVRRSTPIDEIPFLAVARSLGDLWSYNSQINQFIVSPDPDCSVLPIDTNVHRCLIFGTDGLYNMLSSSMAVHIVQQAERHNECAALSDSVNKIWLNPSKLLVERALERWHSTKMRADNTSVVTLMLDPPGPPRAQVLKDRKKNLPESGLKIMTRFDGNTGQETSPQNSCSRSVNTAETDENGEEKAEPNFTSISPIPLTTDTEQMTEKVEKRTEKFDKKEHTEQENSVSITSTDIQDNLPLKERNFVPKLRESTSFDPREPELKNIESEKENNSDRIEDNTIQIHEISSSNIEESVVEEECGGSVAVSSESEREDSNVRAVLRSSKKGLKNEDKRGIKRKMEVEESKHALRKSLRISYGAKAVTDDNKVAPCTLAEEKLKKLAEDAEKIRKLSEKPKSDVVQKKLSITQKIMKSKKTSLKKKGLVKTKFSKKKLKIVLETMMVKGRKKFGKKVEKVDEPKKMEEKAKKVENKGKGVGKKVPKVVVGGKIGSFKRNAVRNASLRSRELKNVNNSLKDKKTVPEKMNKHILPKNNNDKIKEGIVVEMKESTEANSKTNSSFLLGNKCLKVNLEVLRDGIETGGGKRETNSIGSTRSSLRISKGKKEVDVSHAKDKVVKKSEVVLKKGKTNSSSKVKLSQSHSLRKNTLRQRLQKKTETLRKTVLRKSC